MPAANIDDVIASCADDIATVSYDGVHSLYTQMSAWITGMFSEATGIFPPSLNETRNPGQRVVTDWYAQHLMAKAAIEGTGVGTSGVVGTSACIDAVYRVANAVKYGVTNGYITSAQQTAVVTLYNATWEP
jgi:hypothetical protein